MEGRKSTSLAVLGTEDLVHWTLILMDKNSFRFTSCPGWVDPDFSLMAVNAVN